MRPLSVLASCRVHLDDQLMSIFLSPVSVTSSHWSYPLIRSFLDSGHSLDSLF